MSDNYYIPIYANILAEDNLCKMMEEKGAKGLGVFLFLIVELRMRKNFKCNVNNIGALARKLRVKKEFMETIIFDSKLFVTTKSENEEYFESPYLKKALESMTRKRKKHKDLPTENGQTAGEPPQGQLSGNKPLEKERKEKESKEKNSKEVVVEKEKETWEHYVDEAMHEQGWLEVQAKNSGMGTLVLERKQEIFALFRQHVLTQGSEGQIMCLYDAKSYFANFIRQGTKTNKWVAGCLEQHLAKERQTDPYRFETRDPATGARSYFGFPIPPGAPPRPSKDASWSDLTHQWIPYCQPLALNS